MSSRVFCRLGFGGFLVEAPPGQAIPPITERLRTATDTRAWLDRPVPPVELMAPLHIAADEPMYCLTLWLPTVSISLEGVEAVVGSMNRLFRAQHDRDMSPSDAIKCYLCTAVRLGAISSGILRWDSVEPACLVADQYDVPELSTSISQHRRETIISGFKHQLGDTGLSVVASVYHLATQLAVAYGINAWRSAQGATAIGTEVLHEQIKLIGQALPPMLSDEAHDFLSNAVPWLCQIPFAGLRRGAKLSLARLNAATAVIMDAEDQLWRTYVAECYRAEANGPVGPDYLTSWSALSAPSCIAST